MTALLAAVLPASSIAAMFLVAIETTGMVTIQRPFARVLPVDSPLYHAHGTDHIRSVNSGAETVVALGFARLPTAVEDS